MIKSLPYKLGVIIPTGTILYIGLVLVVIFPQYTKTKILPAWLGALAWLLLIYWLACTTDPGYVNPEFTDEWEVKCKVCDVIKPERAHHCKECNRCVLRMDHHCPWTNNCVGNNNFPHFMRFLGWVIIVNGVALAGYFVYWVRVLDDWGMPGYLMPRYKLVLGLLGLIASLLVEITITLLFLRSILNIVSGQTQIESWEIERANTIARRIDPSNLPEFPFDVTLGLNWSVAMGNFFLSWWPWAGPGTDGHDFPKLFYTSVRWPPATPENVHDWYTVKRWRTSEGDNITDFGVDAEIDDVEVEVPPEAAEDAAPEQIEDKPKASPAKKRGGRKKKVSS